MLRSWSAILVSLLCLATTQFISNVSAIKATSLKLRTNPKANLKLTKKDYVTTTFRPDKKTVFGFYVDVLVGTPPQFFSLAFSTSTTTWLPASNITADKFCKENATGKEFWSCFYDGFFNSNKSTTFQRRRGTLDNYYGTGIFAKGTWGSDIFKINQLTISNVSFGLATNWTNAAELGLGVEFDRKLSPYPSLPEVMAAEGTINSILYSIYVNDIRNDGGEIFFGAVDQAKYNGSLRTFRNDKVGEVPVSGVYWIAPDGTNTSLVDAGVVRTQKIGEIQLGTPSLWVPNEVYTALISSIPALTYSLAYDAYTVDCAINEEELGTVQFDIDGTIISIPARQILVEYPSGSGTCVFTAYQSDKSSTDPEYLLGTPFLRSAFSVFDYTNNQTSIAPSVANSTSSTVREVPEGGVEFMDGSVGDPNSGTPTTSVTVPTSSTPATPTPTITTVSGPGQKSGTNIGAIVGGSVGGVAAIAIAGLLTWFLMRRRNKGSMPQPPEQGQAPGLQDAEYDPRNSQYLQYGQLGYKPVGTTQHTYGAPPGPVGAPVSYHENWNNNIHAVDNGRPASVISNTPYTPQDAPQYSSYGNPGSPPQAYTYANTGNQYNYNHY